MLQSPFTDDLLTRPAAVAGSFYPGNASELATQVEAMLALAAAPPAQHAHHAFHAPTAPIKALIVPHAGYIYSGPVAASAYALLAPQRDSLHRVVLLGPCHRVAAHGLVLPVARAFATPLGMVAIAEDLEQAVLGLPQVQRDDAPHRLEHCIEVQLPFLQTLLGAFTLLPLAVGDATVQEVAQVIDRLWGGAETLIVVSSDLSHYHAYNEAQRRDAATIEQVLALQPLSSYEQACGAVPLNGLLACARQRGLQPHLVDQRNSGDTAGDRSRVVGYASFVFTAPPPDADVDKLGQALLVMARNAIARDLGLALQAESDLPALHQPAACFVTLTRDNHLRGCIGSLEAQRHLAEDVRANARAAAFRDPRFAPLTADELPGLRVEVSLLTAAQPMTVTSEEDALRQLRPHIDGLIFSVGRQRSTFLPQVWEQLPQPRQFLAQLKLKAGLAADYWSPDVRLARYEVRKWKEQQEP